MGTALECWSNRRRSDNINNDDDNDNEDTVDQVLMRSHHRSSDSDGPTTTTTGTMQKRFQKLTRNVNEAINSLKNTLNLNLNQDSETPPSPASSKVVWSSIVRSLTQLYPGSQLPDKLLSDIRNHYQSFPLSYAQAGFSITDVLLHIRLLDKACAHDPFAFVIANHNVNDQLHEQQEEVTCHVTFACNSCVSWPTLSAALDASSISCAHHRIFHTNNSSSTLAILCISNTSTRDLNVRIESALRFASASSSAAKNPKFGRRKLPFRLCGCQINTPSHNDQHSRRSSIEQCRHPPIQLQLQLPLSSSSLLVSVDEWQTVSPSSPHLYSILLPSDSLDFTHHLGPTSFKGFFNSKRVSIDKLKGCDKGNAYDFVVRNDLLQLMTSAHRNILPFYGVCVHDNHGLCVVTRFMDGGSLHDFVLKHKKLNVRDVIRIAVDVAEGLKFMNDHGVAFQDLNTHRVFLDRQGNACLGDMGIVSACNTGAEPMEYETDGYRWLAPEIIAADPESVKETWMSNVYSYGMLVWEMVAGESAYSAYSPVQAAVGIAACGLRPDIPTDCPQLLTSLMLKCWNNCPEKRPQFSEILGVLL